MSSSRPMAGCLTLLVVAALTRQCAGGVHVAVGAPETAILPEPASAHELPVPAGASPNSQVDPVKQWLHHLVITIPDFSVEESGFNISVHNLTCRNLSLGVIDSAFTPPGELNVSIDGISIVCNTSEITVDVHMGKLFPHLHLLAVVAGLQLTNTRVNYSLSLIRDKLLIPTSAHCGNVSIQTTVPANGVYVAFPKGKEIPFQSEIEAAIGNAMETNVVSLVDAELKTLTDVNLTAALSTLAAKIEPNMKPSIPPAPPVPPDSMNLLHVWPMTIFDFLVNSLLGEDSVGLLDRVISNITDGTGVFALHNLTEAKVNVSLPGLAVLTFGLLDVELSGLDTWTQLELLQVNSPTTAISQTAMDSLFLNVTAFINVSTPSGPLVSTPLYEEFDLVLNLTDMKLSAVTEVALNKTLIQELGNAALGSTFGCSFKELTRFQTTFLHLAVEDESISLSPIGGNIEDDIDNLINRVLLLFLTSYHTGIPALLTTLIDTPLINGIDDAVMSARNASTCVEGAPMVHENVKEENHDMFKGEIFGGCWAGLTLIIAIVALCWTVEPEGYPRSTECIDFCSNSINDDDDRLINPSLNGGINGPVHDTRPKASDLNPSVPMLLNGTIPVWARVGLLSALIFNCFLFISANTTTGAAAYVAVTIDGDVMQSPALFSFSLGNTIDDMWTAHCPALSIIVALFSGVWPYSKLLFMMLSWVLPGRVLSFGSRMWLMQATDAVGKYSLLDSFLMIVFMVAFRLHLAGTIPPPDEFQDPVDISIDVVVSPQWGLYGYLAATCLSLFLNHIIVHYMRAVEAPDMAPPCDKKEALNSFTYFYNGKSLYFKRSGRAIVSLLLLFSFLLFCVGVYVEAFNFEFLGVAGWALDPTLNGKNIQRFSVLGLYEQLNVRPMFISDAGLAYIRLAYLMFVVVLPGAQLIVLQLLWLVPLTETTQWRGLVLAEILNAWQAVDVFALAIIASLTQIRQFAAFLIGDKADFLNPYLKEYFDHELHGDDKVFDVIATLSSGCWLLVAATVVQFIIGSSLLALLGTALHQESAQRNGRRHESTSKCLAFLVCCFPSMFNGMSDDLIDNHSDLRNEVRA